MATITHAKVSSGTVNTHVEVDLHDWNSTHVITGTIDPSNGGTGIASYAIGDLLYASDATTLAKLAGVAAGQPLISGGLSAAPLYSGPFVNFNSVSKLLTLSRNSTAWTPLGTTTLHIKGADTGEARAEWTAANSDAVAVFGRMNGTFSAPTHVLANDQIMGLVGTAIDTDATGTMQQGGAIGGFASQDWTATHHGYYFRFFGINDNTVDIVNFLTLKNQKAGFGNETNPQYGVTYSANATAGIASPFTQVGFGAIGADSGGAIAYEALAFSNVPLVSLYRANGTNAAKTAPTSNQQLGGFFGNGWDAAAWRVGAGVYAVANQNWSSGVAGARLDFYTTADGGTSNVVAASILGGGIVNAVTGYRVNGAATSGNVLRGDGTNFVSAQLALTDLGTFTSANLRSMLTDEVGTGAAYFVGGALGTPASGTATNLTGTASGLTAGNVTTNANLTGDVTSVGNATTLTAGNAGNLNSGTLLAARMPALTGDITTSAGAVATTIAANAVTNAKAAQMAAYTIKGNATGSTANATDISIPALTQKASPVAGDMILLADSAASNALKYSTVAAIASAGSVASIAGNTGAFTLSGGITNSTNVIKRAYNEAVLQASPSDPATTTSTAGVMMGLGGTCTLTPVSSTRIRVSFRGNYYNASNTNGVSMTLRYGTGTAPTNGAAATGTQIGALMLGEVTASSTGLRFGGFSGIITGLTAGTAYWFDIQLAVVTSGTAGLQNISFEALEI